jgi:hypothetical protein
MHIAINMPVMAPVDDVLYRGIVVEPEGEPQPGIVRVKLTPPVATMKPYTSIDYVICPMDRVTLGWL